jgi:hypothetical protein
LIEDMATAWLYAYSPNSGKPTKTYHTVFTGDPRRNGRTVVATIALSHLASISSWGAGALVKSYTVPFGPPWVSSDFKDNSVYVPNSTSITFGLSAVAAESWAQATIYFF